MLVSIISFECHIFGQRLCKWKLNPLILLRCSAVIFLLNDSLDNCSVNLIAIQSICRIIIIVIIQIKNAIQTDGSTGQSKAMTQQKIIIEANSLRMIPNISIWIIFDSIANRKSTDFWDAIRKSIARDGI